jgi:hypothetical protein
MYSSHDVECRNVRRIFVHLRTTMSAKGTPTQAEIAIRMGRSNTPAVYAEWSVHRLTMSAADPCTDSGF